LQSIGSVSAIFKTLNNSNLIICPVDDALYSSARLHKLIDQHPSTTGIQVCELKGISSRALTSDPDELERLFQVLLPWMHNQCSLKPTL
jgi:hypothetical protein